MYIYNKICEKCREIFDVTRITYIGSAHRRYTTFVFLKSFRVQTQMQCRTRHKSLFVRHQWTLQVKRRTTSPGNYTHAGVFSKVPTSRTSPRGWYFTFFLRTVRSPPPMTTTAQRVCTEVFVVHTYDVREHHNPLAKTITAVRRERTRSRRYIPDTGDPSSLVAAADGREQEWNAIYGERAC